MTGFLPASLFVLAGVAHLLRAQSGTISGHIEDPSGAPVAEARVKVVNQDTNAELKLLTQADGDFVAPFLLPGFYRVMVEKDRFKSLKY